MLSRVFTVKETTGFVIGAVPIKDEASSVVATTLAGLVLEERRHCVEHVVVDSASKELWKSLRVVFPCLQGICENPIHTVMKFKTGNGNHPSPASCRLSLLMVKFSMSFRPVSSPLGEHLWQWTDAEDPSAFELVLLRHVGAKDLPGELTSKARLVLDSDAPFASYTEYLMCMAAFSTEFSADMAKRTAAKGKTLLEVVKAACTTSFEVAP